MRISKVARKFQAVKMLAYIMPIAWHSRRVGGLMESAFKIAKERRMIRLGIPIFPATYDLLTAGKLDVDYVMYYGHKGIETLSKVATYDKPIFLHDLAASFWLNYA